MPGVKFDDLRATRVDDKGAPVQVKADVKESFLARREFLPKTDDDYGG